MACATYITLSNVCVGGGAYVCVCVHVCARVSAIVCACFYKYPPVYIYFPQIYFQGTHIFPQNIFKFQGTHIFSHCNTIGTHRLLSFEH